MSGLGERSQFGRWEKRRERGMARREESAENRRRGEQRKRILKSSQYQGWRAARNEDRERYVEILEKRKACIAWQAGNKHQ